MPVELFLRPRQRQALTDAVIDPVEAGTSITIGPIERNAELQTLRVVEPETPVSESEQVSVELVREENVYQRTQSAHELSKKEWSRRLNQETWETRIQTARQIGRLVGNFFGAIPIGFLQPIVGGALYIASEGFNKVKKPAAVILTPAAFFSAYGGLSTMMASEGTINLEAVKNSLIAGGLVGGVIGVMILAVFTLASRQKKSDISEEIIDGKKVTIISDDRKSKKNNKHWPWQKN